MSKQLGPYVVGRARRGGLTSYAFEVPARLRPASWVHSIPLPLSGRALIRELSPALIEQVQADAAKLLRELKQDRVRMRAGAPEVRRTIQWLIDKQEELPRFLRLKECSKRAARKWCGLILSWSESLGHPDPTYMHFSELEDFIFKISDSDYIRIQVKTAAKRLFYVAQRAEWRPDNPVDLVSRIKQPEATVRLWTLADIDRYVVRAREMGLPALAAIIRLQWEIGQRLTDVVQLEHGLEVEGDGLRYWCSKTNAWISLPLSTQVLTLMEELRIPGSDYVFPVAGGDGCYTIKSVGAAFRSVRESLGDHVGERLQLRALRHTAVTELAISGSPDYHIACVSGHTLESVSRILRNYLPKDSRAAWEAQARRGFVARPEERVPLDGLNHRNLDFTSDNAESDAEALVAAGRRKLAQIKRLRAKNRDR